MQLAQSMLQYGCWSLDPRCADADILASASVRINRFCVRVRRNQSTSVRVRILNSALLWMWWGARMLNIQVQIGGDRGAVWQIVLNIALLVKWKTNKKAYSRLQWRNQCATLHVAINRLRIILVLSNTVVVWPVVTVWIGYIGHGVRNLHTPWLGLIACDTLAHHFTDCE